MSIVLFSTVYQSLLLRNLVKNTEGKIDLSGSVTIEEINKAAADTVVELLEKFSDFKKGQQKSTEVEKTPEKSDYLLDKLRKATSEEEINALLDELKNESDEKASV